MGSWISKYVCTAVSKREGNFHIHQKQLIKVEAPFNKERPGFAEIKMLDQTTQAVVSVKVMCQWNEAVLDIINGRSNINIFTPVKHIEIVDPRPIYDYKINMKYCNRTWMFKIWISWYLCGDFTKRVKLFEDRNASIRRPISMVRQR